MRQSACLVFNPIMVDNYAALFNCTPVGRASDYDDAIHFSWLVPELLVCWVQLVFVFFSGFSKLFSAQGSPSSGSLLNLLSPRFLFIRMIIMIYLFVLDIFFFFFFFFQYF